MTALVSISAQVAKNSEDINKISSLIGEIAKRTSLLSLNAAIEAARAGEAGRGFSVVAVEIGKLAQTVSSSVGEISRLVSEAIRVSAEGVTMATGVSETMEQMEESATAAEKLLLQIGTAVQAQNEALADIDANAHTLGQVASGNADAAADMTRFISELSQLAQTTQTEVQKFQLGNSTAPAAQAVPALSRK